MIRDVRKLFYVSRSVAVASRARFEAEHWDIEIVRPQLAGKKVPHSSPASAGVVDFSSCQLPADIDFLSDLLSRSQIAWVAIVSPSQIEDEAVRQLIRDYCFDFITLPIQRDRIVGAVHHAYGMVSLHETGSYKPGLERDMLGSCAAMLALVILIGKVAMTDAPVFISGESGTGKELTAVAIHERSARRDRPFIAINCGAIPAYLLQSELFGYERGAFTGADHRKIGRVEAANGGTLFLDEVGDLPLESQASLLRFLQERKIDRLGGLASTPVDVRIICATHIDMETAMIDGRFRADLYHRLCVLKLQEPPLRERGGDIKLLAHYALGMFRQDNARKIRGFTSDAITAMCNYPWPGNVRELFNCVRRAVVMAESRFITARDLGLPVDPAFSPRTLAEIRAEAERTAVQQALKRHGFNLSGAAEELGVSRATLYRLMNAVGVRAEPAAIRLLRTQETQDTPDTGDSRGERPGAAANADEARLFASQEG